MMGGIEMLNRRGFAKLVAEEMKKEGVLPKRNCTIKMAYKFMRSYQRAVIRALVDYGGAKIRNWGTLSLVTVPGGELTIPQTGECYEYDEIETPKFKFSKSLARRMNLYQEDYLDNLDDVIGSEMYLPE